MFKSFQVGHSADGAVWFQVWGDQGRIARGKAPDVSHALAKIGVTVPQAGPATGWQAQARQAGWVPPEDCDTLCGEVMRLTAALAATQAALEAAQSAKPDTAPAEVASAPLKAKAAQQTTSKRNSDASVSGDPVGEYLMVLNRGK